MFITNSSSINFQKVYKCGKTRADYLIQNCGLVLLSIDDKGKYVFTHTEMLDKALETLPIHIKLFHK